MTTENAFEMTLSGWKNPKMRLKLIRSLKKANFAMDMLKTTLADFPFAMQKVNFRWAKHSVGYEKMKALSWNYQP